MANRRSSGRKGRSSQASVHYPADAFYAPLFKDRAKKLSKFIKWINSTSTNELTKILVTINETISDVSLSATVSSDKLSKKLEVIVLADIIQSGYRSYGLLSSIDSDRKYEKELKLLGIANN
eukprot:UN13501